MTATHTLLFSPDLGARAQDDPGFARFLYPGFARFLYPCTAAVVEITFKASAEKVLGRFGRLDAADLVAAAGPTCVPEIVHEFQITIKLCYPDGDRFSGYFMASEVPELFGGVWPSDATFNAVRDRVMDRRKNPIPIPPFPQSMGRRGGTSGQTRKPGSHRS